jgi:hypothetical protein
MRTLISACLVLAVLPAAAQPVYRPDGHLLRPVAESADEDALPERLVMPPFDASRVWREVREPVRPNGIQQWSYIPNGQVMGSVTDSVTAAVLPRHRAMDPEAFLRSGQLLNCAEDVVRQNIEAGTEGGFAVAYIEEHCPRRQGKDFGSRRFIKAIRGAEGMYVVTRSHRAPPQEDPTTVAALRSDATQYLHQRVFLCGGASTDERCPLPNQPAP